MSKGPGKLQRFILNRLEEVEWFYLADLLEDDHSRSNYVALLRAADRLAELGKIARWRKYRWLSMPNPKCNYGRKNDLAELPVIAISRLGVDLTNEKELSPLGFRIWFTSKRLNI